MNSLVHPPGLVNKKRAIVLFILTEGSQGIKDNHRRIHLNRLDDVFNFFNKLRPFFLNAKTYESDRSEMTDLYFIRHGQASFGTPNYDRLSDLGVRQANLLADYFIDMEAYFPTIYSGTKQRQMETAQIIASRLKKSEVSTELRIMPELDEFDVANLFMYCRDEMIQDDPTFIHELEGSFSDDRLFQETFVHLLKWSMSKKCRHDQAENFKSFKERVKKGVMTIMYDSKSCKKAAVVTSGGVLALVMQMAMGFTDIEALNWVWRFYNASVTVFDVDHDRLELKLDNSVVHLKLADDPKLITNL